MRICFFSGGFSSVGGIGRSTSITLNSLVKENKHEYFSLQLYNLGGANAYIIDDKIKCESLFNFKTSLIKAIFKYGLITKIKSYIIKNKIDVIIACGDLFFLPTVIAAKLSKIKSVCWEHTNPKVTIDYKFQKYCRRFGVIYSDKNVVITEAALNFYDKIRNNKTKLIYNPVDSKLFNAENVYNVESKKIISVGRVCYAKNYELLIEVAKEVLKKHPDWSWDVYGGGGNITELIAKISELNLTDKLTMKGNVSNIYELYKDYSFIVMTSRFEGFPMVLLEAGAKSLPMVSYDIETGPSEIIKNNENGLLINDYEIGSMVNAIDNLISNEDLRLSMSKNAYETVLNFTEDKVLAKWHELFEELIDVKK